MNKILMITSRADFGGGPEHIFRLIKFIKNDFDVFVACPKDHPYWQKYSELLNENKLIEIPHRKFNLNYLLKLRKFILENKIDLIHSHGKGAGIFSRPLKIFTNKKCIHTFHGLHIDQYNLLSKKLYIILEKIFSVFTDKLITVSQSEKEQILEHKISPDSKLNLIENGIEIPTDKINDNVFHKTPKIITTISRMDFAKYPELLIDIVNSLKNKNNFILQIIGSGFDEDFHNLIKKNNLADNIKIIGTVLNPKAYLLESFCYISTSRWEGLPLGVLDAMSLGVPVIASNVTGNNVVVDSSKSGFLYDINKPEQAAEYIENISNDFELWKSHSTYSQKIVSNNYDISFMTNKTSKLYKNVLNK